jgi:hypothetical protein
MKIIINNTEFEYDFACRMLKAKGGESPFEQLEDIWDDIKPITFKEIAKLENIEQRRIAINHLGTEKLLEEVKGKLIDKQTLNKTTTWINSEGEEETISYKDTYELYQVPRTALLGDTANWGADFYYVKCKDTSTDREYIIWVDGSSVVRTNGSWCNDKDIPQHINAIMSIAWTITTNIEVGGIEKIARQGDCVMIKPNKEYETTRERHLTEDEYRTLIVAES